MKDSELQVLLVYRRQNPEKWAALPVESKLRALEYGAREREKAVLNESEDTQATTYSCSRRGR
jgi:hypothetical protein